MSRDTTTGSHYEEVVKMCISRAAEQNGFEVKRQSTVSIKPGGGKHRIDYELIDINDSDTRGLISCKFQSKSGTAEEKIAYEVIKLLHTMSIDSRYKHSWIIMGGTGWSPNMIKFVKKDLSNWIPNMKSRITILSTDELLNSSINLSQL